MRKIFILIVFFSFKLSAQIIETLGFGLKLDIPKDSYEELLRTYLNPNIDNEFDKNNYAFTLLDYDLKKEKAVKNVAIDNNSDGRIEFNTKFNPEGKIVLFENFLWKYAVTYQYLNNIVIVKKIPLSSGDKTLHSISIDSIFYDSNKNIIKHSYSDNTDKSYGGKYRRIVVKNQYSQENKLEKKYFQSINQYSSSMEEVRQTTYENYKDSIVEKVYVAATQKLPLPKNIINQNNFVSKSVYNLNGNNIVYKIRKFYKDYGLKDEISINYDKSGNIIGILNLERESGYYTYNAKNQITHIKETLGKNDYFEYDCYYDNHDRFISAVKKEGKIKEFERSYTYDKYGNWITFTLPNVDRTSTRTITYY